MRRFSSNDSEKIASRTRKPLYPKTTMDIFELKTNLDSSQVGENMYALMQALYPICRSITGDGVRESLALIQRHIPLRVHEVPSGTKVFDWTVPKEWNIRDAYVKNSKGERLIDFQKSNLHVVSYSMPVRKNLALEELKKHLHTLPDHPDWVPNRTSYYREDWGFCLSHNQLLDLPSGEYEVCIDSSLDEGHLTYGECFLQGEREEEVLITSNICHPSLCNDTLSAVVLVTFLAKHLQSLRLRYSFRFLFTPATIGPITWLSLNEARVSNIKHALSAACVGDPGKSTYKKSRRGNAEIDRAVSHVLKHSGAEYGMRDFVPYGYDERQFSSPGFDVPMGSLMRTPESVLLEHHTSADNLELVQPEYLADSFSKYLQVIALLEGNKKYLNLNPKCEPQLAKRGIYRAIGGQSVKDKELAMFWVLNLSDGEHALLDIAERSGLPFGLIKDAADILSSHDLLAAMAE